LTSPPGDADARKQANVAHANRILAQRILEHYGVDDARRRLGLAIERIGDAAARAMSHAFAGRLLRRLIDDRTATDEWTSDLFRDRVSRWSLVGAIAWPIASIGRMLSRLKAAPPDPFRVDAMDLGERIEQVRVSMDAPLAPVLERLEIDLPDASRLEQQFRADATDAALGLRHEAFMRVRGREPSWAGRLLRWVLPIVILLWFPLLQPLLATGLELVNDPFSLTMVQRLVESLSPTSVLAGLVASAIVLSLLAGMIYAGAVRDASRAVAWLREVGDAELLETLCASLAGRIQEPLRGVLTDLDEIRASLGDEGGPHADG
ncbi:MAG: hypothetical protein KDA28_08940, partial [Phycisphaerales bacterium]|nr:hypothetical protein [Phycisphaerales bacterium]